MFNTEADQINVLDDIRKYLKYWPWFLIVLVSTITISFFYLKYSTKIYLTNAKIQVLDKAKGIELNASVSLFNRLNVNLENEVELLKSYPIIEKVVVNNNLNITFFEKGSIQTSELVKLPFKLIALVKSDSIHTTKSFDITITSNGYDILNQNKNERIQIKDYNTLDHVDELPFEILEEAKNMRNLIGHTYQIKFTPKEEVVSQLKLGIKIKKAGNLSNVLSLSLQGENKTKSELILNSLIEEYNQDGIKDRQSVSRKTIEFINERLIGLFGELDSIENNKKEFKLQSKFLDIQKNAAQSIMELNMSDVSVFEISNQLFLANALKDKLISNSKEIHLLPANFGFNNDNLNDFIDDYNTKVLEYKKLNSNAGIGNPLIINIKEQLDKIKNNLENSLDIFIKEFQFKKTQLKSQNKKINTKIASLPLNEKLLRSIERQQEIKEGLYILLLQKKEEAAINLSVIEPSAKVVEYSKSNIDAISPKPFIIYSMAILLGLLCPFGVLYAVFTLDTKIHGVKDLEKFVPQIPIVAEIPLNKSPKEQILVNSNENTIQNEVFRILSSNISLINSFSKKDQSKVIYTTSSIKGEGKTYVSTNLSLVLASFKKKVLLVGADLRNPQIHNLIGYDKNYNGLSNYLYNGDNNTHWEDNLIKGFKNCSSLDILLGGPIPPNAPQLLINGSFKKLLDEAKDKYDYIIVDTAPTILVSDTFLISKYADIVLYVVRANYSDKKIIKHLKMLHETEKLSNMALVVNGVKKDNYNYGYSYGYKN
ncbi:GumC family protein [Flavivirga aquimarina]|nr:tyrosine-protein kinase family protein [Flavivirga aquimarina]